MSDRLPAPHEPLEQVGGEGAGRRLRTVGHVPLGPEGVGERRVRVYGDTAVNTGYYTFSYEKDGQTQTLPARYSFTLVNDDGKWLIVDHHSSAMPAPPK